MGAIAMRVRAELRGRRRSTVALAVLIGIGGAGTLGAAAAARRTDSAYPRFLAAHAGGDLLVGDRVDGESFFDGREIGVDAFAAMDGVAGVEKLRFYLLRNPALDAEDDAAYLTAEARSPERVGADVDRHRVIEGRDLDPTRVEEAVLTLHGATLPGLSIGSELPLHGVPQVFPEFAEAAERKPLTLRIVGLVAAPGDFPPQSGDETVALRLSPAFYERYPEQGFGFPGAAVIELESDAGAAERFRAAYAAAGGNLAFTLDRHPQDANVQRSIHLQALAMWTLAALGAFAVAVLIAQVAARQLFLEAADAPALRALGLSRRELVTAMLTRLLVAGGVGALLAISGAIALSPLFPRGIARVAEPAPGIAIDPLVFGVGVLGILTTLSVIGAIAGWRATHPARAIAARNETRTSRIVNLLAKLGRAPTALVGARLALQRGGGRAAMPVASTLATLIVGVAVFAAAGTFSDSMASFLGTPAQYGVAWDARVGVEPSETFVDGEHRPAPPYDLEKIASELVASDPDVAGASVGITGLSLEVDGIVLEGLLVEPIAGDAPMPPLLAGRYPQAAVDGAPEEIVLGMRASTLLSAGIGDEIDVAYTETERRIPMRVVGLAVVPVFGDNTGLGETALVGIDGWARLGGAEGGRDRPIQDLFVRGAVDLEAIAALAGPEARVGENVHVWPDGPPVDVVNFGRVSTTPIVLGAILATFAAGTLLHTLITAIGRRRRELAILKTIGFVRAQIVRTVRAHAIVLTLLAVLFGMPLGVIAGRWLWVLLATRLGVVPQPTTPIEDLLIAAVCALAIGIALAAFPGRLAARRDPASVMRSE